MEVVAVKDIYLIAMQQIVWHLRLNTTVGLMATRGAVNFMVHALEIGEQSIFQTLACLSLSGCVDQGHTPPIKV